MIWANVMQTVYNWFVFPILLLALGVAVGLFLWVLSWVFRS